MLLYYGLLCYWLLTTTAAVTTHFVPLLAAASAYGKLTTFQQSKAQAATARLTSSPASFSSTLSAVSSLVLSPRFYLSNGCCFTFYYTLASLLNALLLHSLYVWHSTAQLDWLLLGTVNVNRRLVWHFAPSLAFSALDRHWPPHIAAPASLVIVYAAYQLHFLRRLWECCRVHRFSASSRQHVLVLLFGALFYVALILSPAIDQLQRSDARAVQSARESAVTSAIAAIAFISGSLWQHRCHRTLAELRPSASSHTAGSPATYFIPRGSGFTYLLCPHYTAELLIYVAFAVLRPCLLQWLALLWTVVNLSVTAHKTRHWYASKWPQGEWTSRWNIIPFIL